MDRAVVELLTEVCDEVRREEGVEGTVKGQRAGEAARGGGHVRGSS
jgi:hypothetical protein